MTDPFRLSVVKALAEGIAAEVTPGNGAQFDLSEASFYGRATYGENDPLPMASLIEDPREQTTLQTAEPGKGHKVPWRLFLQGFVADDHANPTAPAYLLAADLMAAVARIAADSYQRDDIPLGSSRKTNRVEQIRIGAPVVRPPDEYSAKAYCLIPLTLDLFETPTAPFT